MEFFWGFFGELVFIVVFIVGFFERLRGGLIEGEFVEERKGRIREIEIMEGAAFFFFRSEELGM